MRQAVIMAALGALALTGCGRDEGDVELAMTRTRRPPPAEVVEVPEVVRMPGEMAEPPLPRTVDENTTVETLRVHAMVVVEEEVAAFYVKPEDRTTRLNRILDVWIPQMRAYQARCAAGRAEKDAWAAREIEHAKMLALYKARRAQIARDHERIVRTEQLKQLRLISAATYERLRNLGLSFGCRYNAAKPH